MKGSLKSGAIKFTFAYDHDKHVYDFIMWSGSLKYYLIIFFHLFQFGRTEMIKDTLNPDFVKKVLMQYFFEESQKLKFELWVWTSFIEPTCAHAQWALMHRVLSVCDLTKIHWKKIHNSKSITDRGFKISHNIEHV